MPLPNFIILGAMKSGTTTLHHKLNMHPSIGMSRAKEPNFFNENFSKGLDWYEQLFTGDHQLYGEASPNYTKAHIHPHTAANMHAVLPDAKLIYIVRDPIKRIISHLHHNLYRDRLKPGEVDKKVLTSPLYINASRYYYQISQYLEYYPRDRFLFLSFEAMRKDTNATLARICDFLGVEQYDFSKEEDKVYNDTSKKYLIKNYDLVHEKFPAFVVKPYHHLFYFLGIKRKRPVLKEKTLQTIKERLHDDIVAFKELTGMPFEEWKMYNKGVSVRS